jgi:uncharacterized protein (TIGR02246 family)
MDDIEAIRGLLQAYADRFDARDAEGFAALFTEDAVIRHPTGREFTGREKLVKLVEKTPKGGRHTPGDAKVDVSGDQAKVHSEYRATLGSGNEVSGTYEDEVVRTPEGWRFARRKILIDA